MFNSNQRRQAEKYGKQRSGHKYRMTNAVDFNPTVSTICSQCTNSKTSDS
jgi:hypothetical protein